jgi:hypothetical protein
VNGCYRRFVNAGELGQFLGSSGQMAFPMLSFVLTANGSQVKGLTALSQIRNGYPWLSIPKGPSFLCEC